MLNNKLLANWHRQVGSRRQRLEQATELLALQLYPWSHATTLSQFNRLDYDLLLPALLQKSLQGVMKQAVPEIVKALES